MIAEQVRARLSRRVEFLLFTAGWGANHFSTLLVIYRRDLGLSAPALGILFCVYALGLVPGLILAGRASDQKGRRAIVLPASALAIAASAVLAFGGRGFGVLLAGRLLFGLAMGSVMSPGSVWVQELSSSAAHGPRRATLALSAGFGFGPLVSGIIAEFAPAPMVWPYVAHGLAMALALIQVGPVPETAAMALAVPTQRDPTQGDPAQGNQTKGGKRVTAGGLGRSDWGILAQLSPVGPWAFGFAAVTIAILPGLMRAHVARPVLYSAFVILTTLMSGVLVQPLTRRIGARADLAGLAVGAAGVFLAARAVTLLSPALVFAVAVLVGSGYGLVMTTGLIEIAGRVAKESRGTAVGTYYVLTYVGFTLPLVHATIAKHWGDAATLRITGAVAVVCLLIRALVHARPRS